MSSTRVLASLPGVRVLSEGFIDKIVDKHPYLRPETVWLVLNTAMDEVFELLKDGETVTFDKVITLRKGTRNMHSPKFRKVYARSEVKVTPRPWFHAVGNPIWVWCYEFQWEPDHRKHSNMGKRKIGAWCRAWYRYLQEQNTPEEAIAPLVTKESEGFLQEEEVKFYLKYKGMNAGF